MQSDNLFSDSIKRKVRIGKEDIENKVKELADKINTDFKGKNPVLIGVLKGSMIFMSDLARQLDNNLSPEFDFIEISSYKGTDHSGNSEVEKVLSTNITNRHVLIVEDIVDKGLSLTATIDYLKSKNPATISTCALLSKTDAREVEVNVEYIGFEIPDKWVEGYGLDTDEKFRNLPDIWFRDQ